MEDFDFNDYDDDLNYNLMFCEACGSPYCEKCGYYTCYGCDCDNYDSELEEEEE